jgi:hypothetical protein
MSVAVISPNAISENLPLKTTVGKPRKQKSRVKIQGGSTGCRASETTGRQAVKESRPQHCSSPALRSAKMNLTGKE